VRADAGGARAATPMMVLAARIERVKVFTSVFPCWVCEAGSLAPRPVHARHGKCVKHHFTSVKRPSEVILYFFDDLQKNDSFPLTLF
jgi:hypothetical protein